MINTMEELKMSPFERYGRGECREVAMARLEEVKASQVSQQRSGGLRGVFVG